jgi:hypothetical protein
MNYANLISNKTNEHERHCCGPESNPVDVGEVSVVKEDTAARFPLLNVFRAEAGIKVYESI